MDKIKLYQTDNRNICFMRMSFLKKYNLSKEVKKDNYKKAYEFEEHIPTDLTIYKYLEGLFKKFNINHPSDYRARSMSTSDVVEVTFEKGGNTIAYFCDEFGFKQLATF